MRRWLGDLPVWWRITIPALGALIGLALVAIATFGGLRAYREASRLADHTQDVLLHSANLEAAFLTMVATVRGYRLDRDPAFLASYAAARRELDAEHAALRALVADNPAQVARVDRLHALSEAWEAETGAPTMETAADAPLPPVSATGDGELIESVRAERAAFNTEELDLLAERDAAVEQALRHALLALGIAMVVEVLLVVLTATVATRSITRPLGRLAATAARWRRGELDVRTGLRSRDELGRVGRAFDHMAEQLAAERAALQTANRGYQVLQDLNAKLISDDVTRAPLAEALAVLHDALGFGAVQLWWRTEDHLALVAESHVGPVAPRVTRPRALGEGIVGHVAATGEELILADAQSAPVAALAHEWLRAAGLHGVVALPVQSEAGTRGALLVASAAAAAPAADTLAVLRTAAQRLALVVERREVRARLEESNEALARATRAKSEFLAAMSHELRTPLNSIIGFSDLLLDEAGDDPATARRRRYVSYIHDSGRHLLSLVNDILDLAKVEAGRMELHATTFDVATSLRAVEAVTRPLTEQKQLALTTDVAPGVTTLHADEGKFKQVLYNLLANAVKFTPEGGRVAILARLAKGALEVTVADTGIGIAPADHERIFEEFQQVDGAVGRRHDGTGLGLALTRRLVELQGGRIWVESALGAGSRFTFTVPLAAAAPSPPARSQGERGLEALSSPATLSQEEKVPAASPATLSQTESGQEAVPSPLGRGAGGEGLSPLVLVVEDDARARELLQQFLVGAGYRVATAAEGTRVVEQARALRPAAITLDVLLPGRDGWGVLQRLKADPTTRDIPVVIVSIVDNERLGYTLGAAAYLVKPVAQSELLRTIARASGTGAAPVPLVAPLAATALVVDDDPQAREMLAALLEPAGYRVLLAATGEEGVALARACRPDVLLLDLLLPGISGFEVVEQLKADRATRAIPIVILTAKDLTAAERAALNGQIAALVGKEGFPRERFLQELSVVLDRALAGAGAAASGVGEDRR
ncbi:MAG TPA: response regulator [Chloroflexota bacterium]|nr:response regulator [Chloroflexota bacterium]